MADLHGLVGRHEPETGGSMNHATRQGLAAVAMALAAATAGAAEYRFVDLGTLGGHFSKAFGVNDSGVVVGSGSNEQDSDRAMKWTPDSGMQPLGTTWGQARAVNSHGVAVGTAYTDDGQRLRATRWKGSKTMRLGTLGGRESWAYGINDDGWIVGASDLAGNVETHPVLWRDGEMIDLGTLGGQVGEALAINDSGFIAGTSETIDHDPHATLWVGGAPTDLGTLGGLWSFAWAINGSGAVAGCADRPNGARFPALWANGSVKDLGGLGGAGGCAYGVNDAGLVVGDSELPDSRGVKGWRAVLWDENGIHDLNELMDREARHAGWILRAAYAINAHGVIVGEARNQRTGVVAHAFMLDPR
jgi:probable HAF family extracellular repeat protein